MSRRKEKKGKEKKVFRERVAKNELFRSQLDSHTQAAATNGTVQTDPR